MDVCVWATWELFLRAENREQGSDGCSEDAALQDNPGLGKSCSKRRKVMQLAREHLQLQNPMLGNAELTEKTGVRRLVDRVEATRKVSTKSTKSVFVDHEDQYHKKRGIFRQTGDSLTHRDKGPAALSDIKRHLVDLYSQQLSSGTCALLG